jgi:cysteine synthase
MWSRTSRLSSPWVFVPQQFENPDNPRVHYEETARELWRQMNGDIATILPDRAERYFSTSLI